MRIAVLATLTACVGVPARYRTDDRPAAAQAVDVHLVLGAWHSTFGAMTLEPDDTRGGLDMHALRGAFTYHFEGRDVVGELEGNLHANILDVTWSETDDLYGGAYLVFEPDASRFTGRWWSDDRDRAGAWTGWR